MHGIGRAGDALAEGWGYLMTCLFWPGERLGLWKLRRGDEPKGSPHMTKRLERIIMWTALAIQAGILVAGGLKLYRLWTAGR